MRVWRNWDGSDGATAGVPAFNRQVALRHRLLRRTAVDRIKPRPMRRCPRNTWRSRCESMTPCRGRWTPSNPFSDRCALRKCNRNARCASLPPSTRRCVKSLRSASRTKQYPPMQTTTTPYPTILTNSVANLRAALKDWSTLSEPAQARVLARLPPHWLDDFRSEFDTFAHDHQRSPRFANSGENWTTWLVLGGRGAGKTRAGAEWVRSIALADPKACIALIGETEHEAREVMVEGISGLLA